ncbi:unnamed protein product [Linum trigynum]|uniref:Uncharacterized protein n=1 Tax=Linum trigynum TaxID=586398 RepID=A0AAV2GSD9_9ROSI
MVQSLKITIEFADESETENFDRLMECVPSVGLQDLRVLGCSGFMDESHHSQTAFESISTCAESLEKLQLEEFKFSVTAFGRESWSSFRVLRELVLDGVCFDFIGEEEIDPFAGFPALKQLSLSSCFRHIHRDDDPLVDTAVLGVNGHQLLTLEINKPIGFSEITVSAAKLTSFTFKFEILDSYPITEVSLDAPSLEHAAVNLKGYKDSTVDEIKENVQNRYAVLIHGLRRAESLIFKFGTTTAFWSACQLLRGRPSPFRRLKSLTLRHKEDRAVITDHHQDVIAYFFGRSAPRIYYGDRVTEITKP